MRLLDTRTLRLSSPPADSIPPYATLSHTWETDQEISLQDLQEIHKHPPGLSPHPFTSKPGYQKIVKCCAQALGDGIHWAWIDTCCIDKTSSVELSEAINSMFRWYHDCQRCYALLSDVSDGGILDNLDSEFRTSRWFTRGWTLQELLAPRDLRFFSKSWNELGHRYQLRDLVSQVTGIPAIYFVDDSLASDLPNSSSISLQNSRMHGFFQASIAQRMSWASRRSTTRKEDLAYCLLGIFNVNIPLLYGEGEKAFRRLQEEIIKQTNDQTLFAWGYRRPQHPEIETDSIGPCTYTYLATSPADFEYCRDMITYDGWKRRFPKSFEVTKKGLRIDIDLLISKVAPLKLRDQQIPPFEAFGLLDCCPCGDLFNRIAIPLSPLKQDEENIEIMRKHGPSRLWPKHLSHPTFPTTVYITDSLPDSTEAGKSERKPPSTNLDGSVIIPSMPLMSVEQLTADPTLHITRPNGLDHLIIREADNSAVTLASGRAYFRFQPINTDVSCAYPDSLVMIAFQFSPPDDIDTGPKKLRKKRKYFGTEMEQTEGARTEREHATTRQTELVVEGGDGARQSKRIGNGWTYKRYCSNPKTRLKGKVHCLIAKTPMVSVELLKTPEYLKALPWTDSTRLDYADQKFTLRIQEVEVMGSWSSVLTLMSISDSQFDHSLAQGWKKWLNVSFLITIPELHPFSSMAVFITLGFFSAFATSLCLIHGRSLGGSLWIVIGMFSTVIYLSRPRPDHELSRRQLYLSFLLLIILALPFSFSEIPLAPLFGTFFIIYFLGFSFMLGRS
ncbi:Heterokaryon incompatibility protein (HET) domain containing protein [Hyaloscypha variabilis]